MKRADIEREYDIRNGIIQNPGRFESEPVWAPYFYDALLNGEADEDDGETATFRVSAEDRAEFPELADVQEIEVRQDDSGFVYITHRP